MRLFFFIFFISIILFSCSNTYEINYADLNKRFDYSDYYEFKISVKKYFNNNNMKLNYSKLNFINHELFSEQYIKNMRKIIENNVHEKYIEESPSDIFSFIRTIINSNYARIDSNAQNQLSDNYQKIIFESMQTYLRYLTEDYTLK